MNEDSRDSHATEERGPLRRASFVFEATLDDVSRVAQALRIFTPSVIGDDTRSEMEIGVVEALTNIVKHGYKSQGNGIVEVRYDVSSQGLSVELKDRGERIPEHFLNPGSGKVFDYDPQNVNQLPEGGMGIALIHAAFDKVKYASKDGINVLTMFKQL